MRLLSWLFQFWWNHICWRVREKQKNKESLPTRYTHYTKRVFPLRKKRVFSSNFEDLPTDCYLKLWLNFLRARLPCSIVGKFWEKIHQVSLKDFNEYLELSKLQNNSWFYFYFCILQGRSSIYIFLFLS